MSSRSLLREWQKRDSRKAEETVGVCETLAREALDDIRLSVRTLQTESDPSFIESLKQLTEDFYKNAGVTSELTVSGDPALVPLSLHPTVIRTVQEALTNAKRHGGATACSIQLACTTDSISLVMKDDGKGNPEAALGFGLLNMKKRATEHGGSIRFESETDQGFTVIAEFSLANKKWSFGPAQRKGEFIMIKIIITDDQDIVREGLASLLQLREELDVIATARNGQEAFEKAKELEPDIVLMDIRMPVSNGVEGTKLITSSLTGVKVLMLTTFKDSELIAEALEEGASGYLLKDMSADTIVKAVMTVQSGGMVLPPELTAQMLNEWKREKQLKGTEEKEKPKEPHDLTEREMEVLAQLGYGLNNKEIAEKLYITEGTVKNHVSNIISKLSVRDRTQVAIYSVRHGVSVF